QFHSGLLIEVTVVGFLKNRCHVRGNRVCPGVSVMPGSVAVQMTKVGDECCARVDRQKNLFQDRVRYRDAIVWHFFGMRIVKSEVKRGERELAAIKNAGVCQLRVVELLNDICGNFFGRIAVIGSKSIQHVLVPKPVLQHLRWRFNKITRDMRTREAAVLGASDNRMQSMAKLVEKRLDVLMCH